MKETTVTVKGFGYNITHLVTVPESMLQPMTWITPFTGIQTPVVGHCGNRVRSVQEAVVVMQEGTSVSCRHCKRRRDMGLPAFRVRKGEG